MTEPVCQARELRFAKVKSPTRLHPPAGNGQRDGTQNLLDFLAPVTEGFVIQVQMFSKDHRQKCPSLLLGSVVCGGMKSTVSVKGCVGGQRRVSKWAAEWARLVSKIRPLYLASSGLCPGPLFTHSSPRLTLVNYPPGEWLLACFWSARLPRQWACDQRAWIPLSKCLSKMSHGSKSSPKVVKHWWQGPYT